MVEFPSIWLEYYGIWNQGFPTFKLYCFTEVTLDSLVDAIRNQRDTPCSDSGYIIGVAVVSEIDKSSG